MRRLIIGISTAILLSGCSMLEGVSILMNFADNPVYTRAEQLGATKQDLLAIQQPNRTTPVGTGGSQCFDYELQNKGKRQDMYVGFTDAGAVNAYGFATCAEAIKAGYVNPNRQPRQK